MTDDLTPQQRSYCMSRIRSKDTKPEIVVRKIAHRLGCRFRLYRKDLPGKPDLVFPKLKKVIFVHGCFWHKHRCKFGRVKPSTNSEYWGNKRNGNVKRDRRHSVELRNLGWSVLIIWECQTKNIDKLTEIISDFLKTD